MFRVFLGKRKLEESGYDPVDTGDHNDATSEDFIEGSSMQEPSDNNSSCSDGNSNGGASTDSDFSNPFLDDLLFSDEGEPRTPPSSPVTTRPYDRVVRNLFPSETYSEDSDSTDALVKRLLASEANLSYARSIGVNTDIGSPYHTVVLEQLRSDAQRGAEKRQAARSALGRQTMYNMVEERRLRQNVVAENRLPLNMPPNFRMGARETKD